MKSIILLISHFSVISWAKEMPAPPPVEALKVAKGQTPETCKLKGSNLEACKPTEPAKESLLTFVKCEKQLCLFRYDSKISRTVGYMGGGRQTASASDEAASAESHAAEASTAESEDKSESVQEQLLRRSRPNYRFKVYFNGKREECRLREPNPIDEPKCEPMDQPDTLKEIGLVFMRCEKEYCVFQGV